MRYAKAENSTWNETKQLLYLDCTAGVMLVPCKNTEDGFEYHLQVNFLSHALLTTLLLDKMESSAAIGNTVVSVVNVSSVAHEAANFRNKIFEG